MWHGFACRKTADEWKTARPSYVDADIDGPSGSLRLVGVGAVEAGQGLVAEPHHLRIPAYCLSETEVAG